MVKHGICIPIIGITVAIKNHENETVGSLYIESPSFRLTTEVMPNITPIIKEGALQISRSLGYKY